MKQLLRQENECGRGAGGLEDHMHGQVSVALSDKHRIAIHFWLHIPLQQFQDWEPGNSIKELKFICNQATILLMSVGSSFKGHVRSYRLQKIDLLTADVRNYALPHTYIFNKCS